MKKGLSDQYPRCTTKGVWEGSTLFKWDEACVVMHINIHGA